MVTRTGTNASETLAGTADADFLYGKGADDTLSGFNGDDFLEGGLDNDTLNGSTGTDTASYRDATDTVTVSLVTLRSSGAMGVDILNSMENIDGGSYADVLTGNWAANTLRGLDGDDLISGGIDNDV